MLVVMLIAAVAAGTAGYSVAAEPMTKEEVAVLLDVNKTTGASRYMDDEHRRRMRRHQAEGLYSYFKT